MATTPKRIALYIFIALAILIAYIAIRYLFFTGSACDLNRNGFDKKGNLNPKCKVDDPNITHTPTPPGTSSWVSDSTFPIKRGSWGPKVKALQGKLGVSTDGKFGPITEGALQAKTGKTQIDTQAEYDSIVIPSSVGVASVSAIGKFAYAIADGTTVYNKLDYSIYRTFSKDEFVGKIIKNSSDTSKYNYTINGGYIVPVADVYIQG